MTRVSYYTEWITSHVGWQWTWLSGLKGNEYEIENLQNHMNLKSFSGGNKVILIWGLEKMNLSASNKVLKLLEEPPKKTFFIMIAEDSLKLLPTIYSRCQKIYLFELDTRWQRKAAEIV